MLYTPNQGAKTNELHVLCCGGSSWAFECVRTGYYKRPFYNQGGWTNAASKLFLSAQSRNARSNFIRRRNRPQEVVVQMCTAILVTTLLVLQIYFGQDRPGAMRDLAPYGDNIAGIYICVVKALGKDGEKISKRQRLTVIRWEVQRM